MGSVSWPRSGSLNGWQDFGHEDAAVTRNDRMRAHQLGSLLPPAGEPKLPARVCTRGATSGRHSGHRRLAGQRHCPEVCRFSAAGNDGLSTHSDGRRPKSAKAGNRGLGTAVVPQLWDFAAGAGVDVTERGGKVRNFATGQGRELGCERVTDRLSNAILRF